MKFKAGDIAKYKKETIILVSKWTDEQSRIHWEVLINGCLEMLYEKEIEAIHKKRVG